MECCVWIFITNTQNVHEGKLNEIIKNKNIFSWLIYKSTYPRDSPWTTKSGLSATSFLSNAPFAFVAFVTMEFTHRLQII